MDAQFKVSGNIVRGIGLTIMAIVLVVSAAQPVGLALANPGPWIGVIPSTLTLSSGGTGATEIRVGEVNDLYGVEFTLTFNPACVRVKDNDSTRSGVQIEVLAPFSSGAVVNYTADNTAGKVMFAASLITPTAPVNTGTGFAVARITWENATCSTALIFSSSKLVSYSGGVVSEVTHERRSGQIDIPVFAPKGTVTLEGRTNYSGVEVYLSQQACPSVTAMWTEPISGVLKTVTNAAGYFEFTAPLPAASYSCLRGYKQGYLSFMKRAPVPSGSLGTIDLLAGNVNQDNCINIFDLTQIGSDFGKSGSDLRSDLNGDGVVNILDLTLAAKNFGQCGPVENWR